MASHHSSSRSTGWVARLTSLASVVIASCGEPAATPDAPVCTGNCNVPSLVGAYNKIAVDHGAGISPYTQVKGLVLGQTYVDAYSEGAAEGACRLLRYDGSSCPSACDFGMFCSGGMCRSPQAGVDIGEVTIAGLENAPVALSAQAGGAYLWSGQGGLASQELTLTTRATGRFSAVTLTAAVPPPLVADGDWSRNIANRDDGDATLRWRSPVPDTRVYVRMTSCSGSHGGYSPIEIECDAPDTGTLVLPGALLNPFYATDWDRGECGGNSLVRYRAARAEIGAPAPLHFVASTSFQFFFHPRNTASFGAD